MIETQLPRVEHLSWKFGRALSPINFVAKNWMTEMMQMHANLMRASAMEHAFDQTNSVTRFHDTVIGTGAATALFVHRHALPMFGVASDTGIDDTVRLFASCRRRARGKSFSTVRSANCRERLW